jgi:hypothetical protein
MAIKDNVIRAIQALPDDATPDDIVERVRFVISVEKRLAEVDAGNEVSHEEARERLNHWLE